MLARPLHRLPLFALAAFMMACSPASSPTQSNAAPEPAISEVGRNAGNAGNAAATAISAAPFTMSVVADFDDPWAIAILPEFNQALITEKSGRLILWHSGGEVRAVSGGPAVSYAGQGGLGDVVLHPDFANNRMVYLSWVETGEGGKGAAVGRGRLSADGTALESFQTIWRQEPFVSSNGHFGHRIAFGPGNMLYISSGERQKFDPAQDMTANLGKIVRLTDAGGIPSDNPGYDQGRVRAQIWSSGHRNPLGIAFDGDGRLWELEMGPAGGDELNIVTRGGNYGYPAVSNGNHYDGRDIPDHVTGDGFVAPRLWWNPAISPGHMIIYSGDRFAAWRGDALIAALGAKALIRVDLAGDTARQAERWDMDFRVRALAQDNDGSILVLEDGDSRGEGRLFRLTPR